MIKRTCPICGAANYSADTISMWTCHTCGSVMLEPLKPQKEGYSDKVRDPKADLTTLKRSDPDA